MADLTIKAQWESFFAACGHPDTPAYQKSEMRAVFFAGAIAGSLIQQSGDVEALDGEIEAFEGEVNGMARLATAPIQGRA